MMADNQCIENRTFDEIAIGDKASLSRMLTWRDIELFAMRAIAKDESKRRVILDCNVVNQGGEVVISGRAEVIVPIEKFRRKRVPLPQVELRDPPRISGSTKGSAEDMTSPSPALKPRRSATALGYS